MAHYDDYNRLALGSLIFNTNNSFNRLVRTLPCKKASLYSGQPRILTVLNDYEGCTLKELSAKCHIGMPSLSVSVRNMEKTGLIRKGSGLRNQRLYLTDVGRERVLIFHTEIDAFFQKFEQDMGNEVATQLFQRLCDFYEYSEQYMKDAQADGGEALEE